MVAHGGFISYVVSMHALVLNLTRFGDLIQSQPVLTGLAARGHSVRLVCLDNFSGAAKLLDGVAEVVPFAGARLLALLDKDWRLAVAELERIKDLALASGPVDMVVNLTPSLPARLLARVFADAKGGAARIKGFGVDRFGFNADSSAWAAFLQMASANRGSSPFNVVDLFCRGAGLAEGPYPFRLRGPDQEQVAAMARLVRSRLPQEFANARLLGVQLGASEERRRWPGASFVQAVRLLHREFGHAAVLFGSEGERGLAERFLAECGPDLPAVSLAGETGLEELGAALMNTDLLVTNDTGTMHLAAGLGIPVAAVFLATAQPFDTGPYAENCLCFEPDMDCHPCAFGVPCLCGEACRQAVSAEVLAAYAARLLGGADTLAGDIENRQTRVWRTFVGSSGFMELESLSGHGDTDRAGWIALQRHQYRRFLDSQEPEPFPEQLPLTPEFRKNLAATLSEAEAILQLLLQQTRLLATGGAASMQQKFMTNWQRLQGVFEKNPALDVLGSLWMFQSQNEGVDLGRLMKLIASYHGLVESFLTSVGNRHES